jgi:hypothetical protein
LPLPARRGGIVSAADPRRILDRLQDVSDVFDRQKVLQIKIRIFLKFRLAY